MPRRLRPNRRSSKGSKSFTAATTVRCPTICAKTPPTAGAAGSPTDATPAAAASPTDAAAGLAAAGSGAAGSGSVLSGPTPGPADLAVPHPGIPGEPVVVAAEHPTATRRILCEPGQNDARNTADMELRGHAAPACRLGRRSRSPIGLRRGGDTSAAAHRTFKSVPWVLAQGRLATDACGNGVLDIDNDLFSASGRLLAVDSDHTPVLESRELRKSILAVDVLSKWCELFEHAGTFGIPFSRKSYKLRLDRHLLS